MNVIQPSLDDTILLTAEDVKRLLRISEGTLYRLYTSGTLPRVYIGRSLRFRREDIEAFAATLQSVPR